jgi:hypothetical protein
VTFTPETDVDLIAGTVGPKLAKRLKRPVGVAFLPPLESWRYDWLEVPALIHSAQQVFEYPMVDRDFTRERWRWFEA